MCKLLITLLLSFIIYGSQSQNLNVNIGPNVGIMDSSFVIQTGITETYTSANHPGAGPYMNAEIYLCQGATLNYYFSIGTSNAATFYLESGATLNLMPQGSFINVYMKTGSTLNANSGPTYINLRKEANITLLNTSSVSYAVDSLYTSINYTFTGWLNTISPCNISTGINQTGYSAFNIQNPVGDVLRLDIGNYSEPLTLELWNTVGQKVLSENLRVGHQQLDMKLAPYGLLFYKLKRGHQIIQTGKLWHK